MNGHAVNDALVHGVHAVCHVIVRTSFSHACIWWKRKSDEKIEHGFGIFYGFYAPKRLFEGPHAIFFWSVHTQKMVWRALFILIPVSVHHFSLTMAKADSAHKPPPSEMCFYIYGPGFAVVPRGPCAASPPGGGVKSAPCAAAHGPAKRGKFFFPRCRTGFWV